MYAVKVRDGVYKICRDGKEVEVEAESMHEALIKYNEVDADE